MIGKPLGVIIVTENITNHVILKNDLDEANDQLAALGRTYNSLFNSLEIPVAVVGEDDVVTMWNPASEAFYGIPASQAIGADFFDLSLPIRVSITRHNVRKLVGKCLASDERPASVSATVSNRSRWVTPTVGRKQAGESCGLGLLNTLRKRATGAG